MAKDRRDPELDRELSDLPPEMRWREWMRRIEAVLFASASPVPREDLARVVGQGAAVDLLLADLAAVRNWFHVPARRRAALTIRYHRMEALRMWNRAASNG